MKIPYCEPKTSRENKTGGWRNQSPVLDEKLCIKCGTCENFCPEGCISGSSIKNKTFPDFDMNYCKGCGLCAEQCPKKAIKMEELK